MNTEQFLARVIPPGNFAVIAFVKAGRGFAHRFFPDERRGEAGGFARWAAKEGMDAYHAMASFAKAEPDGTDKRGIAKFKGQRTQDNTQQLRAFWIDLDVSRIGDKKKAGSCYATQADALVWLKTFLTATAMPPPNLAVSSGYGLHVYWVLEDPMTTADWQPYADALKAALIKHGFTGDAGISADAARVLRPPGTANMKSGSPAPVTDIPQLTRGDYPNGLIFKALAPYVGLLSKSPPPGASSGTPPSGGPSGGATGPSPLAGGKVQSIFSGQAVPNMAAATQANFAPQARPREFARIATECLQVQRSLANNGDGDEYPLWYLGHLTLAFHCVDGATFVHPISSGDPRYVPAQTDAAYALVAKEHARKGNGPPSCRHYERARPGVCAACPHLNRVTSPWDLGVDDGDLPDHYRRGTRGTIEMESLTKDGWMWREILTGDVRNPLLDELATGGYALTFDYLRAGKTTTVRVEGPQLKPESSTIYQMFSNQKLVLLAHNELPWRSFMLGWMDKLRAQRAERTDVVHPFGWSLDSNGGNAGFAVAGTLYRPDGGEEATPGGDPVLTKVYRAAGTLAKWQEANDFVTHGRPDLQVLVACSFGAPLMVFTGHAGLVVSVWSRQSAVGKSSAIRCGQSVWSAAVSMNSMDDTNNYVLKKISDVRSLPCYWDEMKIGNENSDKMVSLALSLSQGKGKGRLNSDSSLKEVGEWDTILVAASNYPLMDHIIAKTDGTDAGAVRLFEFSITRPPTPDTAPAARIIAQTKTNFGAAGRAFAKWVSANYDKADAIVCAVKEMLHDQLHAEQAERFYIAGMASCIAGAKIANHLGLTKFDIPGMQKFLCDEFLRMREARRIAVTVSSQGYDLEQLLSTFMADTLRHKIVTQWFAMQGQAKVKKLPPDFIKWYPQDRNRVDIHVAQAEKILRINRNVFRAWCMKNNLANSDVVESMAMVWGATVGRRVIAGGTGFGGGQVFCIDIPLVSPTLEGYLYVDPAASPPPGPGPTAPAQALAGNQPKV